jgi:hypothetical protein
MAQIEVHDATGVESVHGGLELLQEIGRQFRRTPARKPTAGAMLEREGMSIDARDQSGHVRVPGKRAIRAQLARDQPAAERRAQPGRARRSP